MSSEVESAKGDDEDFECGVLLRDIEEISKALYMHKTPHKTFNSGSKSNVVIQDSSQKDKKSSIWNWKPLKALAHIRNHRFNCCFFLHVLAIEGLPPNFNNLDMCITWKRKADMLRTRSARVRLGMAEFEETLTYRCNVYGSRSGAHSSAKYEPKLFSIHPSVIEAPDLDIGNHWIDISRLLPLTMEELEEGKSSSGKWTTSFKLTGKAKGAILNVSFGFSVLDGNSFEPGYFVKVPDILKECGQNHFAHYDVSAKTTHLQNLESVPTISAKGSYRDSLSRNVKFLEDVLPDQGSGLSDSVTLLYRKLNEGKMDNMMDFDVYHEHLESDPSPESACGKTRHEFSETEFDVIDQGIEVFMKDQMKIEKNSSERFDTSVIETIDVTEFLKGEETDFDEYVEWNSKLDINNPDEQECATDDPENEDTSKYITESAFEKLIAESIENDFLNMLSVDHSQDDIVSDIDLLTEHKESCYFTDSSSYREVAFEDDFDLSFAIQAVESNYVRLKPSLMNKRNAERLENLETEALMQEWGLNEKAFQYSPCVSAGGFGSPVFLPAEEPLKLPSIEEGLGSIIGTKHGGFLRSMNPLLFRNANNGARLIVQVSAPVILPSSMGFTVMDVLLCWASVGVEKMCVQANELMPLEDVTGKTMQQVLSEAESGSHAFNRWAVQRESDTSYACADSENIDSDYVSFEDLIPTAITNIEGLLIEGLKIQCGIPDQETPSSIRIKLVVNSDSLGEVTELSSNFSTEKASNLDIDELIKSTISLKEWLRFDSGKFYVEDELKENMTKLFAAPSNEDETIKPLGRSCGIFRNNFIMGLKVQLRDPLRDYESVGPSMLALFQVDRVYSVPQTEGMDFEQKKRKIHEPLFKVSEVHLAGLNVVHCNSTRLWGSSRQRQSGYRWLLSSGLTKPNKNLMVKSSSGLTEDVMWSISIPIQGEAATWDDHVALNVHVRNPDIIFSG